MADIESGKLEQLLSNQKTPAMKKDPLLVQEIELHEDFYALTWLSLKKSVWHEKEVREQKITLTSSNYFWLMTNFMFFLIIVLLTICLLLYEVFTNDVYTEATWPIVVLRITLVGFAQKKLDPEFYQGVTELRYTIKNPDQFSHPTFAKFVALCQILVAGFTLFCIMLFVCMANEALELIMNFAGLAVVSELDDWVGEQIKADSPHQEHGEDTNEKYNLENLNENMKLLDKMSMIDEEDCNILDDGNTSFTENNFLRCISWTLHAIPWGLLPLLTLPMEHVLLILQPKIAKE